MLLTLDPHQDKAIAYATLHPYSIIALDMGLGKTAVALGIWEKCRGRCLVICPSYLLLNWKWEIEKFLGPKVVVTTFKKGAEIYHVFDSDIVLVSYDLAQKGESELFEWADMVFLDEGQEIKSMKAKRTEFIHRVIFENGIKRVHVLTGTPIKNRVEEYYSLISLMYYAPEYGENPEFLRRFPDSVTFADYFSHREEYTFEARPGQWVTVVKWKGSKNEAELKSYLRNHYIRFTAEDVLKLPPPRYKDILISEAPDKALLAEFTSFYDKDENASTGPTKKAEAALKKVPFTISYVKKLLDEVECVPIYTDHTLSCVALAEAFGVPAITGTMSSDRRGKLANEFQTGGLRVLCATIKSFSTGITLTRANNLVFNDYSWVPGDLSQVVARIRRRGQKKLCNIHRILGSPQDRYILKQVEDKTHTISKVV